MQRGRSVRMRSRPRWESHGSRKALRFSRAGEYNETILRPLLAASRRVDHKWWVFGAIALGTFVSVMDQTAINLALPRLATHFDATIPEVQWVTLGYMLTTGSLLLPMGRLSDIVGRKRVYASGFVVFVVGALLAGISTELLGVILFKVLQGVGAAMVQANGMAIVTSTFPASERGKVIGLFLTVVGMGAIAGPVVGGSVVSLLGWRAVFFLGVPLGLASIVAAMVVLEGGRPSDASRSVRGPRFDWLGASLWAGGIALFLLVMTNGYRLGWTSPVAMIGSALVVLLLATFVWWELRTRDPMLAPELFRHRLFTLGSSASFLSFLAGSSVFFLMPFYLQQVLGYTPSQTGLIIVPTAIFFGAAGPIAGRLSDRLGWRPFAIAGLVFTAASLLVLSQMGEDPSIFLVMGALVLQGLGMGIFYSPNASAVLSTVDRSRYGVATAFLNMVRNTANVTGVALATTIITVTMSSSGYEPSLDAVSGAGEGVKEAFTRGLQTAFLVLAGFVAVAVVLSSIPVGSTSQDTVAGADRQLPSKV